MSIEHAKAVHDVTHPGAKVKRKKQEPPVEHATDATEGTLRATLEAEGDDDDA